MYLDDAGKMAQSLSGSLWMNWIQNFFTECVVKRFDGDVSVMKVKWDDWLSATSYHFLLYYTITFEV